MCFSANASFAAAGVTSIAGVTAMAGAGRASRRWLAAIPLLFAVHQIAEGVLWLALAGSGFSDWEGAAVFTFLGVAEVVWPVWVPLAVVAVETDPWRRKLLFGLLGLGAVVSVAQGYGLGAFPVSAAIVGQHIQYRLDSPLLFRWLTDIAYTLVTVLPALVSTIRLIQGIGVILVASWAFSKMFYYESFISVWCFFAALISALVVLYVRSVHRRAAPEARIPS